MAIKLPQRTRKQYLALWLKGIVMGAADVVPGVSGGTVAFISGIYDELLDSLKNINPQALHILLTKGWSAFWSQINGSFLTVLFSGILMSVLTLAKVIHYALETSPVLVWSFFFGLVLASILYMFRNLKGWGLQELMAIAIGAVVAAGITMSGATQLPSGPGFIFLAGMLAICAMILPGISGSFILLLLGLYPTIITAITEFNIILLAIFAGGCACGLLSFSRLLSWCLHRYRQPTLALLTGFLIGSLNAIWPWKQAIETTVNRHGKEIVLVQENLSPWLWSEITSQSHQLLPACVLALTGIMLVLGFESWSKKHETESEQNSLAAKA
jgi:putative membrane protein